MNTFRTLDLFAGIGGIRLGFEQSVGFNTVFANDFDTYCKVTYDLNFQTVKLDTESISILNRNLEKYYPPFDLLLAGFPCQAFSIAGNREGFEDKKGRGNLFFEIAKILNKRRPAGFLLENVKNLKTHDGGRTFKIISNTLEQLEYHFKYSILNSKNYGNVPQNRERIYIVGFKDKKCFEKFNFPQKIPLTRTINDILEKKVEEKYYYNNKPLYMNLKNEVVRKDRVYQWRRKYVRENKNGVCPTLTANMGMGGHNVPIILDHKGIRKLTPKECLRLQGYPLWYKLPRELADSRKYKQIGNSVTVPVVHRIALNIKAALLGKKPVV